MSCGLGWPETRCVEEEGVDAPVLRFLSGMASQAYGFV